MLHGLIWQPGHSHPDRLHGPGRAYQATVPPFLFVLIAEQSNCWPR